MSANRSAFLTKMTYVVFRNWGEANVVTILDNRTTCTMQIDIHILAIMHSNLSGSNDNDTILNSGNMGSSSNMSSNDQGALDVLQRESSKRSISRCWYRHINNTSVELGQGSRSSSTGSRRGKNDVQTSMT